MNYKFIVLVATTFAFTKGLNLRGVEDSLKTLQKLIDNEKGKILEAEKNINDAKDVFLNMVDDRLKCLEGEYNLQRNSLNSTINEAVSKGMLKNKKFPSFECIAKASHETYVTLEKANTIVPGNIQKILEKHLMEVYSYRRVLNGFTTYNQDLYKKKSEEITKSGKEEVIKKLLTEVEEKMKLLKEIVEKIIDINKLTKFRFFEEAVDFIHLIENNYKKITRDGSGKIMFCVF